MKVTFYDKSNDEFKGKIYTSKTIFHVDNEYPEKYGDQWKTIMMVYINDKEHINDLYKFKSDDYEIDYLTKKILKEFYKDEKKLKLYSAIDWIKIIQ